MKISENHEQNSPLQIMVSKRKSITTHSSYFPHLLLFVFYHFSFIIFSFFLELFNEKWKSVNHCSRRSESGEQKGVTVDSQKCPQRITFTTQNLSRLDFYEILRLLSFARFCSVDFVTRKMTVIGCCLKLHKINKSLHSNCYWFSVYGG